MTDDGISLGAVVRAWRDRLPPSAAGLPSGRARRTKGLRREELAELAGISVDYLVRLEQGRSSAPSQQVLAAIARALQLTTPEREHLYRLAGLAPPRNGEVSDHIPPGMQRLSNRIGETAAVAIFAADWQLIRWNRGWAALLGDPSSAPEHRRNFARDTFPVDDTGPHLAHWPVTSLEPQAVEYAVVADLRRATGRFPASSRLAGLIRQLTEGSHRFAELWNEGAVGTHREDRKIVEHPEVGPVTVDCDVLAEGDADLKIVALTAAPASEDETKLRLAVVSGVTEQGRS